MRFEYLHRPLRIGTMEIKNRLVLPPMATEKSASGAVTDALCDYYDRVTKGGYFGLVITEHSYVSPEGKASPNQVSVSEDSAIEGLSRIVDVIHKNGVKTIAQISHAGSAAKKAITGLESISASATVNPCDTSKRMGEQIPPREMAQADIDRIIACFANAAYRTMKAGYDGVEIHSAHGYLLDQFYSPLTNQRLDAYSGKTIDGRTQLHRQIIRAVRDATSPDFAISLRWGASDYTEGGATLSEVPEAARLFASAGLDMISISGGMCDYFRPGHSEQGWFSELSEAAKKSTSIPILLTGGITNGEGAERLLAEGAADMIGIARPVLRNPDLPMQIMSVA